MKILQLIDTLDAGGAERMAVNYANALYSEFQFSALVVSRKEGDLKNQLNKKVNYYFINKKSTLDFKCVFALKNIIKKNKIEIIHAHGTSFFLAFLVKLIFFSVKIIWHDHYGDSEFLNKRPKLILKFTSIFFHGIIAVNEKLVNWAKQELYAKNVIYLPNFTAKQINIEKKTVLNGINEKRIICLANFREQKNHFLLLKVAAKIKLNFPDWTFHLVGKQFNDLYFENIKKEVKLCGLQNNVFIYNSVQDIDFVLSQANIAILTSKSEGLPVVLLEYGLAKLPVVVTNVGEIGKIISNGENGFLVESENLNDFYNQLKNLILNNQLQIKLGNNLHYTIQTNYTEKAVLNNYISFLNKY